MGFMPAVPNDDEDKKSDTFIMTSDSNNIFLVVWIKICKMDMFCH